jgi:hypothetical protein
MLTIEISESKLERLLPLIAWNQLWWHVKTFHLEINYRQHGLIFGSFNSVFHLEKYVSAIHEDSGEPV